MSQNEPKLTKGMIMTMPSLTSMSPPRIVVFQFNPKEMDRSIKPRTSESKPLRFTGPPEEDITLTATFDATDDMSSGDTKAAEIGRASCRERV